MSLVELRDNKILYLNRLEEELGFGRDLSAKHVKDKDILEVSMTIISQSFD